MSNLSDDSIKSHRSKVKNFLYKGETNNAFKIIAPLNTNIINSPKLDGNSIPRLNRNVSLPLQYSISNNKHKVNSSIDNSLTGKLINDNNESNSRVSSPILIDQTPNKYQSRWFNESQRLKSILVEERERHQHFATIDWSKEMERDSRANPYSVTIKREDIKNYSVSSISPRNNITDQYASNTSSLNSSAYHTPSVLNSPPNIGRTATSIYNFFCPFFNNPTASVSPNFSPLLNSDSPIDVSLENSLVITKAKKKKFTILSIWNGIQGWLITALVGMTIGVICAMVDTMTTWIGSFRQGICLDNPQLGVSLCCPFQYNINTFDASDCQEFAYWPKILSNTILAETPPIFIYVFLSVLFATMSAFMITKYSPFAAGSGIPEIKTLLSGIIIKGVLSLHVLIIKSATLCLAVGSGLSIGKEGPYVHLAASIGNVWCSIFPKYHVSEVRKREIISAACACGVSVAFGAPLGGVLFAMEEMVTYFPPKTLWRTFFCCIIGCLTLQYINPAQSNTLVLFDVAFDKQWMLAEVFFFLLIGALGGLIGAALIKLNVKYHTFRKSSILSSYPITEIILVSIITGFLKYPIVELRENVYEVMQKLFLTCNTQLRNSYFCDINSTLLVYSTMILCFVIVFFLSVISFGMKIPAGIFIPSLFMGACVGRAVGTFVWWLQLTNPTSDYFDQCSKISSSVFGCISPAIYAMVGAAACLTGVTRITVSCVVIMFEITGSISTIVPVMLGVIMAKWVGDAFGKENIASCYINLNKYPFLEPQEEISVDATAGEVMTLNLECISMHGHSVDSLIELLKSNSFNGFPVVTSTNEMLVVGYISRVDLCSALEDALSSPSIKVYGSTMCYFAMVEMRFPKNNTYVDLSAAVDQTPVLLVESTPFERICRAFTSLGLKYCLVIRQGKLVGLLTRKTLYQYVHTCVQK